MTRGTEIVAAIAQQPFWSNENQFATVTPIAVLNNTRLEPVRAGDYPNRNLCWWLIRGIAPQKEVIPGRLVVGRIEEAGGFDPKDPDKDKFQLAWESAKLAGTKSIVEILDGPQNLDPRDLINRGDAINLDHPPSSLVLVRLGDRIYGPFKAEHEQKGRQFKISLAKPQSNEQTNIFDTARIHTDPGFISISHLSLSADDKPGNKSSDIFFASYQLLSWDRFETLQREALDRIRLYTDEEIVRQAAKQVLSRKRLRDFLPEWTTIRDVYLASQDSTGTTAAADVFKALNARLTCQSEAVEEILQSILDSGVLDKRIESAIEARTTGHIESHAAKLNAQVEERINQLRQEEETLGQTVQHLDNELERKRRHEEARLELELNQRRQEFEDWTATEQAAIGRERDDIDTKRQVLEEGLREASNRFKENRSELVRDFLSLSPFLMQLAGPTKPEPGSATHDKAETPRPVHAEPPAFIREVQGLKGVEDEKTFFLRFQDHVSNAGFRFRLLDLVAFHLSVKCGDLTILGGLSGTGKSSLPVLYAQALAGDENRFLAVDVSPAWLEPGDLLGRPNLLKEKFQPSPTGLFEHLVWAATEKNRIDTDSGIWIVCLDEMNLAQPEHYFSGFLQALPRSGGQRSVGVFSPSTVGRDDPWRAWHRIPLNNNIRFVGTVNYDETTKPLSQRLLDRANQLQLDPVPFGSLQRTASTDIPCPEGPPVTMASLDSWTRETTLTGRPASVIDAIQQPLAVLGSPLTPRRSQAIARFVASARDLCSAEDAFDMQLRQRVLSQLRGLFRPEARRALNEIRTILDDHGTAFAGSLKMLERIYSESTQEIDFDAFEIES